MSVQLLDKTRKINKLLHNNNTSKVVFNDICEVLSEILESNILVLSKKGKVLGFSVWKDVDVINELMENNIGSFADHMLNERLLSVLSTKENVNLATLGFSQENGDKYQAIVTPIEIAGERLGTLFIYREHTGYGIDDIILSEYGTTVVGLEMLRSVNEESAEENRKKQIVKSAISTLKMCIRDRTYADWGADLVLSGHFHGGTIRIPGLGGVMTPQLQFFSPLASCLLYTSRCV